MVVQSVDESDGVMIVTVTLSGVDDPKGLDGFTLVGMPKPVDVVGNDTSATACTGFTVAPQECTLMFPTSTFTTADRQLLFIRAEERVRWILV